METRKTVSAREAIEALLENGHTIESVYQHLVNSLDEYGCASIDYPNKGFRLFYTSNPNFANASGAGGSGMYVSLKRIGFCQTVKLI